MVYQLIYFGVAFGKPLCATLALFIQQWVGEIDQLLVSSVAAEELYAAKGVEIEIVVPLTEYSNLCLLNLVDL